MVDPFKKQFPQVVLHQSNGPESGKGKGKGKGALECRYYRAQMYPKIDDDGNFVRDQNGQEEMVNIRVRDRSSHRYSSILDNYFKLVTRCPDKVLEYSWTDEEDKEKARRILADRAMKGIGRLPGDIVRVRETM
ncbi:hypothetical protein VE03_05885 [Pseudogymnoascus sp. 23342-1-I1]|nr:hypothetical protein VE03_05885 [Pseudogymnoascus sp. 23342-1-I1]